MTGTLAQIDARLTSLRNERRRLEIALAHAPTLAKAAAIGMRMLAIERETRELRASKPWPPIVSGRTHGGTP